jgi:hypothetical protein
MQNFVKQTSISDRTSVVFISPAVCFQLPAIDEAGKVLATFELTAAILPPRCLATDMLVADRCDRPLCEIPGTMK